MPADAELLARCEPVYQDFPGWKTPTDGIRRWEDLPLYCRHYMLTIAQLTGTRLTIVSVGPARDQTMFL
jgi:adenylosuccinate synthase